MAIPPTRQPLRIALWLTLAAVAGGALVVALRRPATDAGAGAAPWPRLSHGAARGPLGTALDGYLRRLEAFGFSGSVLVARRDDVVLDAGYGWADAEREEPYTAETQFDIASVSKQFTAAAILELEREGKLHVEDNLARFFPGAPPDKAAITLEQLLTHSAGMPYSLGPEYEPLSRDALLHRAFAAPLLQAPGRRFRYSNVGYSVLAAVAEVAAGRPLGELMRQTLFLPAGMRHTGFRLPWWDRRRLAHGVSPDGPWGTPLDHAWAADGPYWNLRGNGGVISTTGDLYRWHQALAAGTVLDAAERAKYQQPHISEGRNTPSHYAFGWSVGNAPDGSRMLSHTGGNGVFETDFRRYLDDRLVLVVSSNRADYSAVAVAGHLEDRLFAQPDPTPPRPEILPPADLRRCAGAYAMTSGNPANGANRSNVERLQVRDGRGGLEVTAGGPLAFRLLLAGLDGDERELMDERGRKVAAALAGAQRGDYEAMADLIGAPAARVQQPFRAAVNLFAHQLGAWVGSEVLGSASLGGYPYTYARLRFAAGARLAQYRWDGPTVGSVRYPAEAIAVLFLPDSSPPWPPDVPPGGSSPGFASYDVRTGTVQPLRCLRAATGPALSLAVGTPSGPMTLLRLGDAAPRPQ